MSLQYLKECIIKYRSILLFFTWPSNFQIWAHLFLFLPNLPTLKSWEKLWSRESSLPRLRCFWVGYHEIKAYKIHHIHTPSVVIICCWTPSLGSSVAVHHWWWSSVAVYHQLGLLCPGIICCSTPSVGITCGCTPSVGIIICGFTSSSDTIRSSTLSVGTICNRCTSLGVIC